MVRNFARKRVHADARRRSREEFAARGESEPSSDVLVERAAVHRDLVEAVMALDEPYRSTILLRYFEELGPTEIAARQSVPVRTVKTRLARGLDALRARLDRRYGKRSAWILALAPLARPTTSTSIALGALLVNFEIAAYPTTDPVTPPDLGQTLLHLLGVPGDLELRDPQGRPIRDYRSLAR